MGLWKVYVWYFAEDIHLNTAASIFDKCICSTDPLNPEILIWSVSCLWQYSCASNWVSRIFRSSLQPALKLSQSQHPSFISYQAIPPKNIFREIIFLWQKIVWWHLVFVDICVVSLHPALQSLQAAGSPRHTSQLPSEISGTHTRLHW